ncbi:MAG: hypothetical protein WBL79_09970 [Bacillota bacterium]|jgi:leucyl aminopeptidase (aminopeptidase T)|nr:hypothetical protein [Bacillota bacterium]HOO29684.1 hypothetical protein [Bacillota bacterium]HPZ13040.1 hypothetical protein [Bacillota bacterium]HQD79571.1 hypothetical protein [Bacillota bacterium]
MRLCLAPTVLEETSANGVIVADVTIGELVYDGKLLDALEELDAPVRFIVEEGMFAERLRNLLWTLPRSSRHVVELGIGLSNITPTGYIGADECIAGTCHFGIGDNRFYGGRNASPIHLDVVVDRPRIKRY